MQRPIITAKVKELNRPNWIELYADDTYVGEIYGEATLAPSQGNGKYMLAVRRTNGFSIAFFHLNEIERMDSVEPIKQEAVGVGV